MQYARPIVVIAGKKHRKVGVDDATKRSLNGSRVPNAARKQYVDDGGELIL